MTTVGTDNLHILLVEDDHRLADLTREYLERAGCVISHAANGTDAIHEAQRYEFDAIVLDIMLPEVDGLTVLRRVRERRATPVIMLTARGEEADRVLGLELGADDYLAKPFSARELLARIRAVVRRARGQAGPAVERLTIGNLEIDPAALTARVGGKLIALTAYEFQLLHVLARNAGRVLSRDQLMQMARGNDDEAFDRSIDVHVSRLRKKLAEEGGSRENWIRTVRGAGYLFADTHSEPGAAR